jgi:hypothetical protein
MLPSISSIKHCYFWEGEGEEKGIPFYSITVEVCVFWRMSVRTQKETYSASRRLLEVFVVRKMRTRCAEM